MGLVRVKRYGNVEQKVDAEWIRVEDVIKVRRFSNRLEVTLRGLEKPDCFMMLEDSEANNEALGINEMIRPSLLSDLSDKDLEKAKELQEEINKTMEKIAESKLSLGKDKVITKQSKQASNFTKVEDLDNAVD